MKFLSLDLTGLMESGIGDGGVTDSEFGALTRNAERAYHDNTKRRLSGEVGFWDLPDDRVLAREVMEFVDEVPPAIDTVVPVARRAPRAPVPAS